VNQAVQVYYRVGDHSEGQFVCECSDPHCAEKVYVRPEHYTDVRGYATRFIVKAGHQVDEIERVVDSFDGYVVVEKPVVP
jgi:hypothetical protein